MPGERAGTMPSRMTIGQLTPMVTTMMVLAFFVGVGCRPRAPQVEFTNRHYSAALRTAANTRSPERLARARDLIRRDRDAGTIGPEEQAWYAEIIALAEAGRWAEAERLTVEFRRDQRR